MFSLKITRTRKMIIGNSIDRKRQIHPFKNRSLIPISIGSLAATTSRRHSSSRTSCLGLFTSLLALEIRLFLRIVPRKISKTFGSSFRSINCFNSVDVKSRNPFLPVGNVTRRRSPHESFLADADQQRSSVLNLPLIYEKRHRLNFTVQINKSITNTDPRYDMTGERIVDYHRLSPVRLAEFKSIIEFYLDFNQKEKVGLRALTLITRDVSHLSSNAFTNFGKIKGIFPSLSIVGRFSKS